MAAWRLLRTGARDGAWNMAVDEVLWRGVQEGKSPPTLRLFAWRPATLSVGYGQSIERDIDLDALGRLGIPVVRRPTGGRAVLHDREVTYSVVFPERHGLRHGLSSASSILEDYAFISRGLVLGLRSLGVPAGLIPAAHRPDPRDRAGACFSSASAYEVSVRGRKVVGSAQRRGGGAVLQHGSVPLELDVDLLASLFKTRGGQDRARLAAALRRRTMSVREALDGREVSFEEASPALESGFRRILGGLFPGGLTPEEEEAADVLCGEKYAAVRRISAGF